MLMWSSLRNTRLALPSGTQWYTVLARNMQNMPEMKKMTPNAICHPWYTAGHAIQMEPRANITPIRWVQVLAFSVIFMSYPLVGIFTNGVVLLSVESYPIFYI